MAIIQLGPIVSEVRGSIGGTTFARNPAGAYARKRTKPIYPGSGKQVQRAAQMSQITEAWKNTLTTAQRNVWTAKSPQNEITNKLGDRFVPSGFNLYARSNLLLLMSDQAMVTAPPVVLVVDTPRFTLLWEDTLGVRITNVHNWAPTYTDRVLYQFTNQLRLSINFFKGPFANITSMLGATIRTVPTCISGDHLLISDSRSYFRFRVVVDDGAISSDWIQSCDVGTITP